MGRGGEMEEREGKGKKERGREGTPTGSCLHPLIWNPVLKKLAKTALKNKKYILWNAVAEILWQTASTRKNFTEIGQSADKLWPKNDFQYGGRAPS